MLETLFLRLFCCKRVTFPINFVLRTKNCDADNFHMTYKVPILVHIHVCMSVCVCVPEPRSAVRNGPTVQTCLVGAPLIEERRDIERCGCEPPSFTEGTGIYLGRTSRQALQRPIDRLDSSCN